ncbi:chromate transporter [Diaphorobacter aerolatus]|uniref:Chromate transporter n=1 Tax=Diaphorobacter aerolatus TaxID=1288495 RepID=A0A7H0GKE6_9BURK|nr:chromate transporter [Diaphorobacter aerolatus]QNP48762.1 chromate transporter [Diaphorobacter aerolatus]
MDTHGALQFLDWLNLFVYYLVLSLLSVGGAIAAAPDMHRYLVDEHGLLTDVQFTNSIAIAQSAPGPNVLFVALFGWNIGMNAAPAGSHLGWLLGCLGVLVCMVGILLPSSTLTFVATRWAQRHREKRAVRAFKQGMAPVVVGLLCATGWVLASAHGGPLAAWPLWCVTAVTALLVWRTRIHLLWLLAVGAALGALGVI